MGRQAKGAVRFDAARGAWVVRVTLIDGRRRKPVVMTGACAMHHRPGRPAQGLRVRRVRRRGGGRSGRLEADARR